MLDRVVRVFAVPICGLATMAAPAAPAWSSPAVAGASSPAHADEREYTVKRGDTLWDISARQYQDPYLWPLVAAASASIRQPDGRRLTDANLIDPGWTLRLPEAPRETARTGPSEVPSVVATAVAAGGSSSCAITAGGQVRCWGWMDQSAVPVVVPELSGAVALTAGANHACALLDAGTVACWGYDESGQTGAPADDEEGTATPVEVPVSSTATAVAAGEAHSCALIDGGRVECWGGTPSETVGPTQVAELAGVTAIAAGSANTCAIVAGGQVTCWNVEWYADPGEYARKVVVSGVVGASAIAAGDVGSCAVVAGGQVMCWSNRRVDVESGSAGPPAAVAVQGVSGATSVSVGGGKACAVLDDGRVVCWGDGHIDSAASAGAAVAEVAGLRGAITVSAGRAHVCALVQGGRVACWGANGLGQLGDGTTSLTSAVPVVGIDGAAAVVDGGWWRACALLVGGRLVCWDVGGGAEWGLVGPPGSGGFDTSTAPVEVAGIPRPVAVSFGVLHACAVLASGKVACWGDNSSGQLGARTPAESSSTPVSVARVSGATAVAAGRDFTCAIVQGGQVRCWGDNSSGQLGNRTSQGGVTPVPVTGLRGATAIAAGDQTACAVVAGGRVRCWGSNEWGLLGDGTTRARRGPVAVAAVWGATALDVGDEHACAVVGGGRITCWGDADGLVGDPGVDDGQPRPVPPMMVPAVYGATGVSVASNPKVSCALIVGGHVTCWGYLEDDDASEWPTRPVIRSWLPSARSISVNDSESASYAALSDGTVVCWGSDTCQQLGARPWAPRWVVGLS